MENMKIESGPEPQIQDRMMDMDSTTFTGNEDLEGPEVKIKIEGYQVQATGTSVSRAISQEELESYKVSIESALSKMREERENFNKLDQEFRTTTNDPMVPVPNTASTIKKYVKLLCELFTKIKEVAKIVEPLAISLRDAQEKNAELEMRNEKLVKELELAKKLTTRCENCEMTRKMANNNNDEEFDHEHDKVDIFSTTPYSDVTGTGYEQKKKKSLKSLDSFQTTLTLSDRDFSDSSPESPGEKTKRSKRKALVLNRNMKKKKFQDPRENYKKLIQNFPHIAAKPLIPKRTLVAQRQQLPVTISNPNASASSSTLTQKKIHQTSDSTLNALFNTNNNITKP